MRIRSILTSAASLVFASSLLVTRVARADDDAVSKAAVLAREAEKLEGDGKYPEACEKLAASQELDPRGGTLLDLALCREKEGKTGTAYNLFEKAEKAANDEKRSDRVSTARIHKNSLFAKLARLTVTVPKDAEAKGLEVAAGGQIVPQSEWGKSYPVDSGSIKVTASAPEKETWETTVELKPGIKKAVTVPVLKAGSGPAPKKNPGEVAVVPDGGSDHPDTDSHDTGAHGTTGGTGGSGGAAPTGHKKGRVVVDFGLQAGMHISAVSQAPQDQITGTLYKYQGTGGSEFLASCGEPDVVPGAGTCNATFNPQLALLVGGQLFVGYAFTESVQFGGRVFAGAHLPLGYQVMGGPSISFRVSGPFWLGVTPVVGTSQVTATVTGAKGSVPSDLQEANKGDQVDIKASELAGGLEDGKGTAPDFGRLEVGGVLEVSFVLADVKSGITGSLMASAWPSALWSQGGVVFNVPLGLSYRFY